MLQETLVGHIENERHVVRKPGEYCLSHIHTIEDVAKKLQEGALTNIAIRITCTGKEKKKVDFGGLGALERLIRACW